MAIPKDEFERRPLLEALPGLRQVQAHVKTLTGQGRPLLTRGLPAAERAGSERSKPRRQ